MLVKRCYSAGAILVLAFAVFGAGCIEDVGVTLIAKPDSLHFDTDTNRLAVMVSKNVTKTGSGPLVARADVPWIVIENCTDGAEDCLQSPLIKHVNIGVRVDRSLMTLGTNKGHLILEAGGASQTKVPVYAEDLIQADFTASTREALINQGITFTDASVTAPGLAPISRWQWDFGDGATSTLRNPIHIYTAPGLYDVSLTVTAGKRQETLVRKAYITVGSILPIVDFAASTTLTHERDEVTFTDLSRSYSGPIIQRLWDFGDGGQSTEERPIHQFANPGVYTVSLTVWNQRGSGKETKTDYIVVQRRISPRADFSLSQITPFVLVPVQFADLSYPGTAPIVQWIWEFGDGFLSTEQHPVHTFTNVGFFEVKLTVITRHGFNSKTMPVEVTYMPPTADFAADDQNPSINEPVQFSDLSLPGMSPLGPAAVDNWLWNFGDGQTSTEQNPIHAYNKVGSFTVSLTVGSSALPAAIKDTMVKTNYIVVVEPPKPSFTVESLSPFTKEAIAFTNTSEAGTETALRYEWNFGDPASGGANISAETNPSHVFSQPGTFTVTLSAITPTRSVSVSKNLVVDARPVPMFAAEPTQSTIVQPVQFTDLTDTSNTRPIESRLWQFGDGGQSTGRNPSYLYENEGTYTVSLTITYSHSVSGKVFTAVATKSNFITITLPLPPTAAFSADSVCATAGAPVQFTDESAPGSDIAIATYLWDFGDGATSAGKNPAHTYLAPGNYTVTLTVTTDPRLAPYNTDTLSIEDYINVALERTALDNYVSADPSGWNYQVINSGTRSVDLGFGFSSTVNVYIVDLTSQTWRTLADYRVVATNSAQWKHYMVVVEPQSIGVNTGMLFINGGSNSSGAPTPASADSTLLKIAAASQSVVADLRQVPNQDLEFFPEAGLRTRSEDESIAYTFDKFLNEYAASAKAFEEEFPEVSMLSQNALHSMAVSEDTYRWPLLLPMVKSAVRALDAIQDMYRGVRQPGVLSARNSGSSNPSDPVQDFFVLGGSKRGWTTWLTAAYERGPDGANRVRAIAPTVIDVLNMDRQMEHHFNAYGYWAPAIYPYAQEKVFERFNPKHPQYEAGQALLKIVDPYEYRCRLDLPKYIMNSTGDQFFLPDSAQWYFDRLDGESYLNYVPNTSHGLDGYLNIDDPDSAASGMLSFYASVIQNASRPQFSWTFDGDGAITVRSTSTPQEVSLWQAYNSDARDFRLDATGIQWTKQNLSALPGGRYRGAVTTPAAGYRAFFIQLKYPNSSTPGGLYPYIFTTPIRVLPKMADGSNLYPAFEGQRYNINAGARSIPLVVLRGSPYEMGRQYGQLMQTEIVALLPSFLDTLKAEYPAITDAALDAAWEAVTAAYDPAFTGVMSRVEEEILGIAEGTGLYNPANPANVDGLIMVRRANMALVLAQLSGSAVAATRSATVGGNTYQSNNINWSLGLGLQNYPCMVYYIPAMAEGFPHLNVTFAGFAGALTGINIAGTGLSLVGDPDQPGDPDAFTMVGNHISLLFRDLLYDARSSREAWSNAQQAIVTSSLVRRQHVVVGDGRYLLKNQKAKLHLPDGLFGVQLWNENDPADEFFPKILPNLVYSGPRSGAFAANNVDDGPAISFLRQDFGNINETTLIDVNNVMADENNLVNVVYSSPWSLDLYAWVAYADGSTPASQQPMVRVNLHDYIP